MNRKTSLNYALLSLFLVVHLGCHLGQRNKSPANIDDFKAKLEDRLGRDIQSKTEFVTHAAEYLHALCSCQFTPEVRSRVMADGRNPGIELHQIKQRCMPGLHLIDLIIDESELVALHLSNSGKSKVTHAVFLNLTEDGWYYSLPQDLEHDLHPSLQ